VQRQGPRTRSSLPLTGSDAGSGFELLRCVRLLNCFIVLVAEAMAAESLLIYSNGDRFSCDSAWLPMRGSTEDGFDSNFIGLIQ